MSEAGSAGAGVLSGGLRRLSWFRTARRVASRTGEHVPTLPGLVLVRPAGA